MQVFVRDSDVEEGVPEARGNIGKDSSRTDDPVRLYLRETSSVGLLSREGEIAIAKRIEAGTEMAFGASGAVDTRRFGEALDRADYGHMSRLRL
jgi:RNA polymerase primary sigma factor